MFTIYGLNGRVFSGTLDGVRELAPVQSVAKLRAVEPVHAGEFASIVALAQERGTDEAAGAERRPREALAAYAQTATPQRQPVTMVQQMMSRRLISVPASARLSEVLRVLTHERVGQAPVLDARGHVVGLITRADLLPRDGGLDDAEAWRTALSGPVSAVMWSPVPSAHFDTPIREVAELLLELQLPGMAVQDERGELKGFISRSDLLRAITREPPLDLWS
jgi:CBS domain-containing protein